MWPFGRNRVVEAVLAAEAEGRSMTSAPLLSITNPAVADYLGWGITSYSGVSVNEVSSVGLSAVYRACNVIAGVLASMPIRAVREDKTGQRDVVRSVLDELAGPDSYTNFEFIEMITWHLLLHGDAFLIHRYNAAGALVGLNPVHPLAVNVEWDYDVPGRKAYKVNLDDGTVVDLTSMTLTQIMGPTTDGLRGMSVIVAGRNSLGTAISGDRTAARMFANGAMISGLVTPEEEMDEDEAISVLDSLRGKMQGQENAGMIAMINKKLKFTQMQMTLQDAQFLESRKFSVEEIARWFGVPPHLLMQTDKQTSWGTGVEEQNRGLRLFTYMPWTSRIEARLTTLIPRGQQAEFDFTRLERSSPEDEARMSVQLVDAGIITPNEARRQRNLPPIEGGDVLRTQASLAAPAPQEVP